MCNETSWKTYRVSLAHTQLLKDKQANNKASKKYARPRREETEMPKGPHEVRVSAHVTWRKKKTSAGVRGCGAKRCNVCCLSKRCQYAQSNTKEDSKQGTETNERVVRGNDGEERSEKNMGLYIVVRVPPF